MRGDLRREVCTKIEVFFASDASGPQVVEKSAWLTFLFNPLLPTRNFLARFRVEIPDAVDAASTFHGGPFPRQFENTESLPSMKRKTSSSMRRLRLVEPPLCDQSLLR